MVTDRSKAPVYHNPKYRMCGLHVEKWALIGAIVLIILTLIEAILEIIHSWWNALLLIEILALGCILLAIRLRVPGLYIPFLVLQTILLVVLFIFWLNVIVSIIIALFKNKNVLDGITDAISYSYSQINSTQSAVATAVAVSAGANATGLGEHGTTTTLTTHTGAEHTVGSRVVTLVTIGWTLLYSLVAFLYYIVVFRAFLYMRDEKKAARSRPGVSPSTPQQQQTQQAHVTTIHNFP